MTDTSVHVAPRRIDRYDIAAGVFGVALGVLAVLLAVFDPHNAGSRPGVAIGVLFMTVPVGVARHRPVGVAAFVAAASLANDLVVGHAVRCGVALPAAWFIAFVVGVRTTGRRSWVGLGFSLAGVAAQCPYDPRLGWSAAPLLLALTAGFYGAGRLVRSRSRMVTRLRERNAELRREQARTASMAVAADRAQLAGALDSDITWRLAALGETAETGREVIGTDAAIEALATIETTGRSTLNQMREVVGTLRSESATQPVPALASLPALARRRSDADVRITIDGGQHPISAVVEVSTYRIVEHLLEILEEGERLDVRVAIGRDEVIVTAVGGLVREKERTAILAKIRARIDMHEGRLEASTVDGACRVTAWIPLAAHVV